jgi:hypothetical protein
MAWLKWFEVGKQLIECAAELLTGQACTFTFTWKGITYSVTVNRRG